jgi:hypothetical protein
MQFLSKKGIPPSQSTQLVSENGIPPLFSMNVTPQKARLYLLSKSRHSESHLCLFSINIIPQKGQRVLPTTFLCIISLLCTVVFSKVSKLYDWLPCILAILYLNPASRIPASRHWASCFVQQPKAKTPNVTISG